MDIGELLNLAAGGVSDTLRAGNFESYEEAYEAENYIMRQQRVSRPQAKDAITQIAASGRLNDLRGMMKKDRAFGTSGKINVGSPLDSVGQFDIKVTRLTANIAESLPVPMLGSAILESGYEGVITLSGGMTLQIKWGIRDSLPNKLQLIFTKGASTDTIEISTADSALPYPAFLNALTTDKFQASKLRYIVGDETASSLQQLENSIVFFETSTFGRTSSNKLSPSSSRDPMNNQKNILDINGNFTFDKYKGFWVNMNATANLRFTLSMFLEKTFLDKV